MTLTRTILAAAFVSLTHQVDHSPVYIVLSSSLRSSRRERSGDRERLRMFMKAVLPSDRSGGVCVCGFDPVVKHPTVCQHFVVRHGFLFFTHGMTFFLL